MPSVTVVLLSHHFQLLQPYSAVETGTTFFSLPSFILTFFPPSLAKPGTSAGAGGGNLSVGFKTRSSGAQAATFRPAIPSPPPFGHPQGSSSFVAPSGLAWSSSFRPFH